MSAADRREALASTTAPHDALPLGVKPGTTWRNRGRRNAVTKPADYAAFVPWGQIFPAEGATANPVAGVELRNMRGYLLRRGSGAWEQVSRSDRLEGRIFKPNFDNNKNSPTTITYGPAGTRAMLDPQRPFHFWPKEGRVPMNGADVAGVLVVYQARLAPGSPRNARYLVGAGADYWKTRHSRWQNYTTNGDAGIGRFRRLTPRWRTVFMYTGTRADFARCVHDD
ncbi:hypothetical protein ASG37_16605 [Sphingomonas sp. Leaf407]|uniref:hypothetical protein n=1 Tax=unclassified Sphingomonas TaxID=196159 RepID=UPI000714034C|nr:MULTISPECIES: hypothetical protein [unclassified Sphingomonas]KQN33769.1 hypothetical protein ASE97_16595 [Sphingomonas sp. Leaf42]KQT25050.1 hypothetical protein ASG37_16605 [Sphingomonas sp. Leaf407]